VYLIIKNRIKVEFGLLWIIAFSVASFIVLSYKTLDFLTKLLGAVYPSGTMTVLAIGFIFLVLIIVTAYLTNMSDKIKNLSQYISFLEKKVRSLQDENKEP
jgi:Na+-transporting methylmalonyl-CoA/oxaloacetate decarboxylase gamma subunit